MGTKSIGLKEGYVEIDKWGEGSEDVLDEESDSMRGVLGSDLDFMDNEMANDYFDQQLAVFTDFILAID